MAKVKLTSAGIAQKEAELFALTQAQLDAESTLLSNSFRKWISDNFDLTTKEADYLKTADDNFIRMISSIVFVSVRNKIPVKFKKSLITTAVKRVRTNSSFDFDYTWGSPFSNEGDVNMEIEYL